MSLPRTPIYIDLAILAITIGGLSFLIHQNESVPPQHVAVATTTQVSASAAAIIATSSTPGTEFTSSTPAPATPATKEPTPIVVKSEQESPTPTVSTEPATPQIQRIENPYSSAPIAGEAINIAARAALVNIFCYPHGGSLRPISGSGVIIDPRGVILTNAHVAQYVLLSQDPSINLECFVRSGSPAVSHWIPNVLYIPSIWVSKHAQDFNADHATGTGEHDYALLLMVKAVDNSPLPAFPYLAPDTREAIAFVGDPVLVASYPAEFAGGSTQFNLFSATSFSEVQKFLTFATSSVDVISVGSVIGAQGGSSGGAIVNAWNRLVGIITTTSEGATTGDRDLRGVTLNYINRDLITQTGNSLTRILSGNVITQTNTFAATEGKILLQEYLKLLK